MFSPQGKRECLDPVLFHLAEPPFTCLATLGKSCQRPLVLTLLPGSSCSSQACCAQLCTGCASALPWRDAPGARGSHAGWTTGSQHSAWPGKGQVLETPLPSADRCLSTAGWMALLGPSQNVQENRAPTACSALLVSQKTLLVFPSGNSLDLST